MVPSAAAAAFAGVPADRALERLAGQGAPGVFEALGLRRGRLLDRRRRFPVLHQVGDVGRDGGIRRRPAVQPGSKAHERRPVGLRGVGGDRGFEGGADALDVAGGESVVAGVFELVHGGFLRARHLPRAGSARGVPGHRRRVNCE